MTKKPLLLKIFDWASVVLLITASYMVFFFAPMEAVMGNVQRVFYFHVSMAWVGSIGFLLAVAAGIAYLITKDRSWDVIGVAGIEVGLVFALVNIITGSIWARPIWNTWWTWDPRLVTATIAELVYIAYIMLRQGIDDPNRRARFGAVYAIIGFVSVPLSFFSIRIWRTIHPIVVGGSETASGAIDMQMTTDMRTTFFFSLFTFTVIAISLVWHRIRLGILQDKIEQLKLKVNF